MSVAALGVKCRSGCRSRDHGSYAACLRAARVRTLGCDSANHNDRTANKVFDGVQEDFRNCVYQGIIPDAPSRTAVDYAKSVSDSMQTAYQCDGSHWDAP